MRNDATEVGELVIEPMQRRDLRAVLRIEKQVYTRPWTLPLYRGELAMPVERRAYRVARSGGRLVGYGGLMFEPDEAHVTTLAVDPGWQRHHIGATLLLVLIREAVRRGKEHLTLEVRMSNEAARGLYQRFGFAPAGVRRNYYAEVGEDALIMWLHDAHLPAYADRLAAIEAELPAATLVGGAG